MPGQNLFCSVNEMESYMHFWILCEHLCPCALKNLIVLPWLNMNISELASAVQVSSMQPIELSLPFPPQHFEVLLQHIYKHLDMKNKYFFSNVLLIAPSLQFYCCKLFHCPLVCGRWMVLSITFYVVAYFPLGCPRLQAQYAEAPDCWLSCGLPCWEHAASM